MTRGRSHGHRWTRVHDPIYRIEHWVFVGPHATLAKAMAAVLPATVRAAVGDGMDDEAAGRCCGRQPKPVRPGAPYCTVSMVNETTSAEIEDTFLHEMIHATTMTMKYVGVEASWSDDEAFTYYLTWLVREVRKGLRV